jgi:predicted Zn-dependent peptidase
MALSRIDNNLDEEILTEVTAAGMRFIINPKPGFSKTMGVLGIRFGSTDNAFSVDGKRVEVPAGTAHFLEHKMFEGEDGDVTDLFAAHGASCNAGTGFANTSYLFTCTDLAVENLRLLLDFVQRPYFTAKLIEKEQGIIGQEIKMYDDDPDWNVFFNLMGCLYREHPVNQNIAGDLSSIRKIDTRLLDRCYRAFYRPGNMVLVLVGKMDKDEMIQVIHEDGKHREVDGTGLNERFIVESDPSPKCLSAHQRMVVARPKVLMGFKDCDFSLEGAKLQRKEIVTQMVLDILFGKSSRNHEQLYREGTIDDSFSAYYSGYTDFGFTGIGGDTDQPDRFRSRLEEVLKNTIERGIEEEDFLRQRNKYLGKFIRTFNSVEGTALTLMNFYFKKVTPSQVIDIIQRVTCEDLNARLRGHFDTHQMAFSVIEPMESTHDTPKT